MIAILLAGGYAKRLWPITLNKPKTFLTVGGKPILDHLMEKITKEKTIGRTIISTNLRFQPQFEDWLLKEKYENVALIPDESTSQSSKIGAVKALANIVSTIDDDFIVLAADSLFKDDLHGLLQFFRAKRSPTVALYSAPSLREVMRGSEVCIDESGKITEFVEKPGSPRSTLVGSCIFVFPAHIKDQLKKYIEMGQPQDNAGSFIEWLHKREPVYGFLLNQPLLDIGTVDAYRKGEKYMAGEEMGL